LRFKKELERVLLSINLANNRLLQNNDESKDAGKSALQNFMLVLSMHCVWGVE